MFIVEKCHVLSILSILYRYRRQSWVKSVGAGECAGKSGSDRRGADGKQASCAGVKGAVG